MEKNLSKEGKANIQNMVRFFCSDISINLKDMSNRFGKSKEYISDSLFSAVSKNICSDNEARMIIFKMSEYLPYDTGLERGRKKWSRALILREETKRQERYEKICKEIQMCENILENFDDYFFEEPDTPKKEFYEAEIERLNNLRRRLEGKEDI